MKDWTTEEVATKPDKSATITALLYVLGSTCIVLFLESTKVSFRKGPPTSAPTATFGLGSVESSHFQPLEQLGDSSAGIEAPL